MIRSIALILGVEIPLGGNHESYDPELHPNVPLEQQPDGDVILTRPDGKRVRVYKDAIAFTVEKESDR